MQPGPSCSSSVTASPGATTTKSKLPPVRSHDDDRRLRAPVAVKSVRSGWCRSGWSLIGRRPPRSLPLLRLLLLDLRDQLVAHLGLHRLELGELILRQDALQLAFLLILDLLDGAHLHERAVGALDDRLHLLGILLVDCLDLRQLVVGQA